ncbi:MAG: tRNA1(Val) (adenine(37)-N6)-methyltransferase [Bacilli bacterium]|nr:tRNA1(Val) (adenine(37)-N6)-methyltransferase [Bacilli bacterium]
MKMTNYLLGYKDMYIVQDPSMFKFSLDSILLPNFVTINKNTKEILDIGTGNAPIPLILSRYTNANITGIEIQKEVAEMAKESVKINNLDDRIKIINADINKYYDKSNSQKYDIITCNPPYFKVTSNSHINDSEYKTLARHEVALTLENLIKISRTLLKTNGTLALVHRPERLVDILSIMRQNNIEPKKIQFVYPKHKEDANIVLIEGTLNGKPGLKILEPLYVYDDDNKYTEEIEKYFSDKVN